ncbi:PREDICTED: proclotting enzyme-like isoform X2 [Dinoponera quadriceps]|uniref:Proclotting enzyme-like isoform X2 n=1 Tax=Dinoponera quadriceps TaxID=609295 RepID=A0A6P3XCW3_DINQU|nr:PREDICTED: proclotting enzyme-like isoform X2 [Dinoponera quadriceps]
MQQLIAWVACTTIALGLITFSILHNIYSSPQNNSSDTSQHQSQPSEKYNECGRNINVTDINIYRNNATEILPGQWSWLVAFYFVQYDFHFKCFGSLVTNRHVLTVAHCFKNSEQRSQNIPASAMLACLGQHDGKDMGSTCRELESYKVHPDYKHQLSGDSDLAIVVLRTFVEYSPTIRPICLWNGSSDLQDVVNKSALLVRFDREDDIKINLSMVQIAEIPIVSQNVNKAIAALPILLQIVLFALVRKAKVYVTSIAEAIWCCTI